MSDFLFMVDFPHKSSYAETALIEVDYLYDNYVACPECGRRVTGAYWLPPREVVLTKRVVPDFLYVLTDRAPFVISEKALTVIQNAGLTGILRYEEIEIARFQRKSKTEIPIPKYYHIELAYSRITINHERSVIDHGPASIDHKKLCPLCHPVLGTYDFYRKLSLNMNAYEGYDIFHCYEMGEHVFLSQRFIDVCKENNLTNLFYTPSEAFGRELYEYFVDGNEDAISNTLCL